MDAKPSRSAPHRSPARLSVCCSNVAICIIPAEHVGYFVHLGEEPILSKRAEEVNLLHNDGAINLCDVRFVPIRVRQAALKLVNHLNFHMVDDLSQVCNVISEPGTITPHAVCALPIRLGEVTRDCVVNGDRSVVKEVEKCCRDTCHIQSSILCNLHRYHYT